MSKTSLKMMKLAQRDVWIVNAICCSYYAVMLGDAYGNRIELQYSQDETGKHSIYCALAMNDNNCREPTDPEKVMPIEIARQTQFHFELDMLLSSYILNFYYNLG